MRIYDENTIDNRVWTMHMDGMSITDISKRLRRPYAEVKEIVLEGFRRQDPKYNDIVFGKGKAV